MFSVLTLGLVVASSLEISKAPEIQNFKCYEGDISEEGFSCVQDIKIEIPSCFNEDGIFSEIVDFEEKTALINESEVESLIAFSSKTSDAFENSVMSNFNSKRSSNFGLSATKVSSSKGLENEDKMIKTDKSEYSSETASSGNQQASTAKADDSIFDQIPIIEIPSISINGEVDGIQFIGLDANKACCEKFFNEVNDFASPDGSEFVKPDLTDCIALYLKYKGLTEFVAFVATNVGEKVAAILQSILVTPIGKIVAVVLTVLITGILAFLASMYYSGCKQKGFRIGIFRYGFLRYGNATGLY
jgi:hypothetical protein